METAYAGGPSQGFEARQLFRFFDQTACLRHRRCLTFGERGLVRATPLAGAETLRLRLLAGSVKGDVLAPCEPRGATRTAIDPGRRDRIIESAVGRSVTPFDRMPSRVIGGERG
jgi:hypothetical protein